MAVDASLETRQYLTFVLEGELFALTISSVREVLEYTTITRIPRTSEYMRGIINVRGSAVPVLDLNLKFGRKATVPTITTSIIIVEVNLEGELTTIGALADSVEEVFELNDEQIAPPPRMGSSIKAEFIQGMGRHDEKFIMILDADKIFSIDEIAALQ
ncbi:chemotaxis protein CheW [Megalodesulfovibrio paquesii]